MTALSNLSSPSSAVTFTTTGGGGPSGPCTATGTVQTQWGNGYVIQPVTVTNSGSSAINGWTVTFTLPCRHSVTGSWNATLTTSGQTVTAKSMGYNGNLGPSASTSFGFQVSSAQRQHPDGVRLHLRLTVRSPRGFEGGTASAEEPARSPL
ncbi:cellulose binding domain-containing protein [Nonomuraea ferruginea]